MNKVVGWTWTGKGGGGGLKEGGERERDELINE